MCPKIKSKKHVKQILKEKCRIPAYKFIKPITHCANDKMQTYKLKKNYN